MVNLKFPLVCTGCGTTWAIQIVDFEAPGLFYHFNLLIPESFNVQIQSRESVLKPGKYQSMVRLVPTL
jgi:hypothetical protein